MAPRPCITPDCPHLTDRGPRCAGCEKVNQRARNADTRRGAYRPPGECWICGRPGADTRDDIAPAHRRCTLDRAA